MRKGKRKVSASIPAGLACSAAVSMTMTLVSSMILAKLIQEGKLRGTAIGYTVMAVLSITAFTAGITAAARIKHLRAPVCAAAGGIYWIMLTAITALFFGGQYQGFWGTGLMILIGAGLAALWVRRKPIHPKRYAAG